MGPFPPSFGNLYILLAMEYVSKSVEAIACPKNDANTVVGFIQRNILSRYGASRTIISDEGSHFANNDMKSDMLWDWLITLNQMGKQKYPIGR